MADPGDSSEPARQTPQETSSEPLVPAARRGRLVVRDRVVEQVARRAARDVDAVSRGRATTWRTLASPLTGDVDGTRVDVDRTDDRVGLTVHLAVGWPHPLPDASRATRDAVRDAVTRCAGLEVVRTDVVVDVAPASDDDTAASPAVAVADGEARAPVARTPVQAPRSALPAVLLALGLVGLGVVGVRDALVTAGLLTGTPWARSAADAVSGATPSVVVLVGGAVAVLVGLWFVLSALRPRPEPHLRLTADSDVWMRSRDVARVARSAATRVGGVSQVKSVASRRRVVVTVTGRTGTGDVDRPVTTAVEGALSDLDSPPTVRVRTKVRTPEVVAPVRHPVPQATPRRMPATRPTASSVAGTPARGRAVGEPGGRLSSSPGSADAPTTGRTTPAPDPDLTKDAS